jgi:hypothetical protein
MGQSKMDNPEKLATLCTQDEDNPEKLATLCTQDEDKKTKYTTQYVLDTTIHKQTQIT